MNQSAEPCHPPRDIGFTGKQGQYPAFIHAYTKINRRAPAEAEMRRYFQVSPPTVHRMVLNLHRAGLIQRVPGEPRSIKIPLDPKDLHGLP